MRKLAALIATRTPIVRVCHLELGVSMAWRGDLWEQPGRRELTVASDGRQQRKGLPWAYRPTPV